MDDAGQRLPTRGLAVTPGSPRNWDQPFSSTARRGRSRGLRLGVPWAALGQLRVTRQLSRPPP